MNSNNKPHTLKTGEIKIMLHLITIKVAAEKKMQRSKIVPRLSRIFFLKEVLQGHNKRQWFKSTARFSMDSMWKKTSHFQLQIWPHLAENPEEALNDDLRA